MPLCSETHGAASQPSSAQSCYETAVPGIDDSNGGDRGNSSSMNADAQGTVTAVQHLSDMLRSTELDWQSCPSDSGSDTVDAVRIIKSSGLLRNRLAHYYSRGSALSDLSSVEEFDDSDSLDPGIELELLREKDNDDLSSEACNAGAGNIGGSVDNGMGALRWCPQFLSETCVSNVPSELRQPTSETVVRTDDMASDLPQFSDADYQGHYYPLRQRSEKNLHPYTKLVWTNPADLLDGRNRRRDVSLLYDLSKRDASGKDDALEMDIQEDSEDAEYIPGMVETAEQESQMVDIYADSIGNNPEVSQPLSVASPNEDLGEKHAVAPLSAKARREGLTYKHLAARRRQTKARRPIVDQHVSFPSVEALLAGDSGYARLDSASDNHGADCDGAKEQTQQPKTNQGRFLADDQQAVKLYSDLSSSSSLSDIDVGAAAKRQISFYSEDVRSAEGRQSSNLRDGSGSELRDTPTGRRRRRLLSRRHNAGRDGLSGNDDGGDDDSGEDDADESLPTAKARKLNKISRRHIRGVLPFSFMRGLDKEKQNEIREEVSRWQHRNEERPRMRRVLSSSPRPDFEMEGGSDSDRVHKNSSRQICEIKGPSGALSSLNRRQPLFDFNFLDIYRWSYPEQAAVEHVGRAPDFLRVAARECRRRAGALDADDPWRKHIRIAPRTSQEVEDEDMAQSILGAWRLGIMDVRRVYFCDDEQDTEGELDDKEDEVKEKDHPRYMNNEAAYLERFHGDSGSEKSNSAILISDDEAAEDNSLLDRNGRGLLIDSGRRAGVSRNKRRRSSGAQRVSGSGQRHPLRGTRPWPVSSGSRCSSCPRHRQPAPNEASTASGIRTVIDEFAAFDSDHSGDDDDSQTGGNGKGQRYLGDHASFMTLPPAAISQHLSRKRMEEIRRREFVQRFNQWRPAPAALAASRSGAYSRSALPGHSKGHRSRPAFGHGGEPARQAEFLFDEDPVAKESTGGFPAPHVHAHRKRQTRIVAKQQARPSPVALDAVAERIGRATGSRQMSARRRPNAYVSSMRSAPRKTAQPTRVQLRIGTGAAANNSEQEQSGTPSLAGGEDEPELLFGLVSGTRFHSDSWVGQGGVQRMQRLLLHQVLADTESAMDVDAGVFDYNDILCISLDASVEEFCQAFDMLCMVWRKGPGTDAVLRWMEFSQLFVIRRSRRPKDLAAIARGVLACAHAQLPTSDAPVALVLGVTLMQLSREIRNWDLYNMDRRGAVGDECDELEAWSVDRLAKEIDNCVLVAAGLLPLRTDITFLGFEAQIVVTLLHALRTASEFVPVASLEDAVLRACASGEQAGAYWRALARLATLAQINQDGVAAPRPATQWHRALCSLVEVAVDKDLRPGLGDAGVRQVFVRVHRLASLGLRVAPSSRLHVLLFRYLEARRFASLEIEPAPALPRFFTRYSGSIPMQGGLDTCTVLWLRALDAAFGDWAEQLSGPGAPKILRGMRVLVSKLLPTRILTVDSSQGLAALANYYAVVLFFLHAVPHVVVRPARLYSQLQALLRFRESASFTARRVYFEAWSAAASILGHHLRLALEKSGSRDVDKLASRHGGSAAAGAADAEYFAAQGVDPSVSDYFLALGAAVSGWADALEVVLAENSADAWRLADGALAYAVRVLHSAALAGHAPTVLLLALRILQARPVAGIAAAAMSASSNVGADTRFSVFSRMRAIVDVWQQAAAARDTPGSAPAKTALGATCSGDDENGDAGATAKAAAAERARADATLSCSQNEFEFVDSIDLLAVAAEAEELERQATFASVDRAILQTIHGGYIPDIRRLIISRFSSLGPSPRVDKRGLDSIVLMLAEMVAICVDAGIRTWESFLDEYGRDSLYLIPDAEGRRRVLVVFAVCAVDILRKRDRPVGALEHLIKDIWFVSICDIRLSSHVQRLSALLHWCDGRDSETPVFDLVPVDGRLLDQRGSLKLPIGQRLPADDLAPEEAAAVSVAFVDCVLQKIASVASSAQCPAGLSHVFCSWINRLLSTQKQIHEMSSSASLQLSDAQQLIDAMSQRILSLVRSHCTDLPINSG